MPKTTKQKDIDITKSGPMTYRQLQSVNDNMLSGLSPEFQQFSQGIEQTYTPASLYDARLHAQQDVMSPLSQQQTFSGEQDYWGRSHWDNPSATEVQFSQLGDIRAENQPWYSKLINGIGKAGVLAGTTALETAGLLYGAGHSLLETAGVLEDNGKSWVQDLWDNPITNALQKITEASEEFMPNYYTRDEQENPFGNIFTANFLGDKFLKNLGFMVGAFYGGIPASKLIGAVGKSAVRSARAASLAERAGMARRVGELAARYGDDDIGLKIALTREGLTEAERGKRILEGFDKVRNAAQATRATTQTLGSLGSAINEGAIEALNNSKDWARMATQQENERYQNELAEELGKIEMSLGGTEMGEAEKTKKRMELAQKHEKQLVEIEKGRARMGNADLLLNIPILMASNMYQLGKLYTRGFDSTRRQMGSLWNGHALQGSLAKGTLKSGKTVKGAVASALWKSNTEGLEEYLQRAASDGAGEAVNESLRRFFEAGQNEEAKTNVDDYIAGFGKAIATNLGNPNAWEEYMIGAVSSMLGMPVFGSQTKNAYMNIGPVGFAGGLYGNYKDYMNARDHENKVAEYLNQRVKDPKFKALYDNLKKQDDYDKWLQEQIELGDKSKYKDLELEKFYQDLNAAASSGHLEEFKQMVGYNTEYSDEELEDIVKQTTRTISPEQQKKQDEDRLAYLQGQYNALEEKLQTQGLSNSEYTDMANYSGEIYNIQQRLQADDYQEKLEGPFIDVNGQMNVTNPDKMREILERNRQNLLQGIDDYLKIRNDIDIETDGRLDDKQIELLTQMKGKILSYDRRSAEMSEDLINNLGDVQAKQEQWQEKIKQDLQNAQEDYNNAKAHWEAVKKGKHNQEYKDKVEKQFLAAEKKLNKAKAADRSIGNVIKLLQMLTEEKETTASERAAEARGYGEGIIGRMGTRLNRNQKRNINSDEAQAILANPQNAITLVSILNSKTSDLNASTRDRLTQEAIDLSSLANQKMAYNNKVREFMGDPTKINEAYQQAQDKISQEEKDNKSEELSLNIKQANSMADLDRVMRDAYNVNPEIAKAALNKAKQTADESTKKFIADYEKAVNFYGDVARQAQKLPQEVAAGVIGTAASEWENALQEGVGVYDKFIEGMNAAAEELDKSGVPGGKETAAGIKQVLSDLNVAKVSTATNKDTKKPTRKGGDKPEAPDKPEGFGSLAASLAARRAGKKDGSEQPQTDTKESLQKEVEQEVRDSKEKKGSYKIDELGKLSKALKDKIQKYNEEHSDDEFNVDFEELLQRLTDEAIVNDNTNLANADLEDDGTALGEDNNGSDRAERMHENLRVTFRSDYPTAFRIFDGRNLLDYKVPYDPDTEQLKAVQRLLHELKAYQFVDKNYLGYVAKAMEDKGEPVTIHLLRSTDETISKDKTNPITFLAIKWNDDVEAAIRKYGFGGNKGINISDEVRPVTINGEQYHIVGVMTLNSQVDAKVSEAFASLQGALNKELNPQIEQARENGQPFVVSQLTTILDNIYTGRLDKKNNEADEDSKAVLYDFMTSQQGDESRRTSSEWDNGMEFYFGTVVNGFLNTTNDEKIREQMEDPNDAWMDKNNGAIIMYVPKADGKLYPVRVIRRTVADWLTATADGSHTGQQLLAAIPDGSEKNEYLGNIVNYLRTIYDEDAAIGDKMAAKMMLQKYFIFGKQSPIHFNGGEVTLQFDEREHDLTRDSFEEFVTAFFNVLADENIKFSLPAHSIESVRGRDIVKSGIFEVRLRGFYNFNANFTITPIDGEGHQVTVEPTPEGGEHFTGGNNIRATEMQLNLDGEMKTYIIQGDGTVTLNGQPVSTDTQNLVTLIRQAEQGTLPLVMSEQLDIRFGKSPEVRKFVSNGVAGFDGVYIIHVEEDWVYDNRKGNHDNRLYKLNSDEGVKLMKSLNQAISDFVQQHMSEIRELKKAQPATPETVTMVSIPTMQGGDTREVPGVKVDKKDIKVGDIIGYSGPETESIINYGTVEIVSGDDIVLNGAILPTPRTYYRLNMSSRPIQESAPLIPSTPSTPSSTKIFAGKDIVELNAKDGGLAGLLVANSNVSFVKKVYAALQAAEEAGIPIDQAKVSAGITAILEADREEKKQLLNDLINEINGCNK